ncbi:hypothetical protein LTR65_003783 [Meristemomyces frigidus]
MASKDYSTQPTNKVALATAKVVPVFLALIVVYCSYVVVGPLSIEYLLNNSEKRRIAAGIAIPIVWFVLLVPVAATWLRLLVVVFGDPGYVPCDGALQPPAEFWMKDVFVCTSSPRAREQSGGTAGLYSGLSSIEKCEKKPADFQIGSSQGLPIWCEHCRTWKPDRAHHNQDTGRCTLKMDHFCPWRLIVGGVVGERSMKFFLQFLTYSWLLSTYAMIVLAYFVHEDHSNVQWLIALGLAGFFVLFTLAVLLPPELQNYAIEVPRPTYTPPSRSGDSERPLTSEIDDPSHSSYFNNEGRHWPLRKLARSAHWKGTVTYPLEGTLPTDQPPLPAPEPRTFAILETWPGMNPWDLGTPWRNLTAVLGTQLHNWLLPIRHSPCCDHSSAVSFYPLGPQFEELLEDVGLVQPPQQPPGSGSRKRKKRLSEGWQNGERPDGWVSEKEARRTRRTRL